MLESSSPRLSCRHGFLFMQENRMNVHNTMETCAWHCTACACACSSAWHGMACACIHMHMHMCMACMYMAYTCAWHMHVHGIYMCMAYACTWHIHVHGICMDMCMCMCLCITNATCIISTNRFFFPFAASRHCIVIM